MDTGEDFNIEFGIILPIWMPSEISIFQIVFIEVNIRKH